jgi:hypothetical protein
VPKGADSERPASRAPLARLIVLTQKIEIYTEPPPQHTPSFYSGASWLERWEQNKEFRERMRREADEDRSVTPGAMKRIHELIPPPHPGSTKQYYNEWVKTIPFQRGNYLISKQFIAPFKENQYVQVVQIQEVHLFLQFDQDGRPCPIEVCNALGGRWWTALPIWKRVPAPRQDWRFDLPAE